MGSLAGEEGRGMIRRLQQGMKEDGFEVPMTKLRRWFEVPRRTVYYRPVKSAPKVQERFAAPIKQLIEADPSFGYRTVAGLLQFNKNTVQRIFQIKGWQVRKRAVGHRPRIEALPSAATTAMSALEQALIARFGTLGRVTTPFLLRSDNGLAFTSRAYTRLVRSYGLRQAFITPHCPKQNGMIERVIRTLKEQCVHRHRFETQQHASRVIGEWIRFYNTRRPHQALGMKTPAMAYALAA
jgi:putative transposase